MLGFGIAFSPLVPDAVLWAALAVAAAIALLLFVGRTRGAAVRALALALLVAALANPSLTREDRDPAHLGRGRGGRQEPEPGFRRPHGADRGRARPRW